MDRRASDLDIASALALDVVARYAAKVELLDRWFDQSGGIVREDGTPAPAFQAYMAALGGLRLASQHFAEALRRAGDHAGETLEGYIAATYPRGGNGNGDGE